MEVRLLSSAQDCERYDAWVNNHAQGNLWQSLAWKNYQESLGRTVRIYGIEDHGTILASALVVIDRTIGGLPTWEMPRGPLFSPAQDASCAQLLENIVMDAKNDQALAIYLSPPVIHRTKHRALEGSQRYIHPEATRIIDLTKSEEDILTQMHSKGRYNIKVAEKHVITVEECTDSGVFHELVKKTGQRDKFIVHSADHYAHFLADLLGSFFLLARDSQKTPIAGLVGVVWGKTGIYYYGASNHEFRATMAPYMLQWEAMKLCKAKGCTQYDLFGIAPPAASADHPWQGISSFKEKFGGSVVTYPSEQQIVLRPIAHTLLQAKRRIIG